MFLDLLEFVFWFMEDDSMRSSASFEEVPTLFLPSSRVDHVMNRSRGDTPFRS